MNNLFLKIAMAFILSFTGITASPADPTCYKQMRSLNLSLTGENKKVCQKKEFITEPIQTDIKEIKKDPEESTIGMEAYFVYPHIENNEEEPAADGIGANISVGF